MSRIIITRNQRSLPCIAARSMSATTARSPISVGLSTASKRCRLMSSVRLQKRIFCAKSVYLSRWVWESENVSNTALNLLIGSACTAAPSQLTAAGVPITSVGPATTPSTVSILIRPLPRTATVSTAHWASLTRPLPRRWITRKVALSHSDAVFAEMRNMRNSKILKSSKSTQVQRACLRASSPSAQDTITTRMLMTLRTSSTDL